MMNSLPEPILEMRGIGKRFPGVIANPPSGAFYMTVVFEDGVLNDSQSLHIEDPKVRATVERLTQDVPNDRRFVYYLMAATGVCVVPLSGFCCARDGFRLTLLECDDQKRAWMFASLTNSLREYLGV